MNAFYTVHTEELNNSVLLDSIVNLKRNKYNLFFSNTILFLFVIDTHYEKQLITPLGFVKFFRPPHC
jgi:hypothetical protein